jgi:hypothetical protein
MKTKFGKSLIASGLVAALGMNLAATPAFADHGKKHGKNDGGERRYERSDSHRHDGRRDRSGRKFSRSDRDDRNRRDGHVSSRRDRHDHKKHGVKIIRKPTVVVKRPVTVHKTVIEKKIVHSRPVVTVGHRHHRGHYDYYRPAPTRVIVVPERRRYRNVWVKRHHGHRYHGYGHYRRDDDAYKWLAFTAISVALINNMTEYQQRAYEDAQIRATTAPIGETIRWHDAGVTGTVTPTREGTSSLNRYCREFQKTVTIGNRTEQAYGTACMQPDGAWEVVSDTNNY